MATWRAMDAVVTALVDLLTNHPERTDVAAGLDVQAFTVTNFRSPMTTGVSIFPFRLEVDGTVRAPERLPTPDGQRRLPQLPVDLHLLVSAWGGEASTQLSVAAWMMRVLADTAVLDAATVNASVPGAFGDDEFVWVQPSPLPSEDLLRLWELLGPTTFQLSMPYLVRGVRIDSSVQRSVDGPVAEREFRYHELEHQP